MKRRILVIDDDAKLLTLLKMGLEQEGFSVVTAKSGKEGLKKAYTTHPDAVVLDIMMAEMDGWVTCQRLRQICNTPILMLTAKASKEDVVKGLSLGADDYVTKPCNFDELKARIHTALRRSSPRPVEEPVTTYDDGELCIDLQSERVTRNGEAVHLTPTESQLLMYLVSNRGRIIPHKELLIHVWGPQYADETKYLSVYIRYLRKKIEEDPSNPRYIITKHRVGYCFAGG